MLCPTLALLNGSGVANLLGEILSGSAGMGFTPHIITIAMGEVRMPYHLINKYSFHLKETIHLS